MRDLSTIVARLTRHLRFRKHRPANVAKPSPPEWQLPPLPNELWLRIMIYATEIPNRDELGVRPEQYSIHPCEDDYLPSFVMFDILSKALITRASLVRVCRRFYLIGIPLLYAHLQLTLRSRGTGLRAAHSLRSLMNRDPSIGLHVRRVYITMEKIEDDMLCVVQEILHYCQNMTIFFISAHKTPSAHQIVLPESVLIIYYTLWNHKALDVERIGAMRNLRYLQIFCLERDPPYFTQEIDLPNLEALAVAANLSDLGSKIVLQGVWKFPSLRLLEISTSCINLVIAFLEAYAPTLTSLEIPRVLLEGYEYPEPVLLPNLKLLNFSAGASIQHAILTMPALIEAPELLIVGIYDIQQTVNEMALVLGLQQYLIHYLPLYPKVTNLRLSNIDTKYILTPSIADYADMFNKEKVNLEYRVVEGGLFVPVPLAMIDFIQT